MFSRDNKPNADNRIYHNVFRLKKSYIKQYPKKSWPKQVEAQYVKRADLTFPAVF